LGASESGTHTGDGSASVFLRPSTSAATFTTQYDNDDDDNNNNNGPTNESAYLFVDDLGRRISNITNDSRKTSFVSSG